VNGSTSSFRTGETDHEARHRAPVDRVRAPPARREQRNPQRRRRIEDRGLVGRDVLHGDVGQAVRDDDVAQGHNEHVPPFGGVERKLLAQQQCGRPQQHAGEHEPDAAKQERRHRMQADARHQVGRPPDEIDGGEAHEELHALRGCGNHAAG
jgi:hypothetical protein